MKRTIKRCLLSLIASATMFSVVQAQGDGTTGTVQLGANNQVPPSPSPAGTAQVAQAPSTDSPAADGPSLPSAAPALTAPNLTPGYNNFYRVTPVDQVFIPRYFVNSYGGGLYGYGAGYATMGAFVPYKLDDSSILFTSAMGMVTYDSKGGASVGTGWRKYYEDMDRIIGLSFWYDFDNGHFQPFQQVGLSFESLGRFVDYRVNGYVPVGNPNHVIYNTVTPNAILTGNTIGLLTYNAVEQSYSGFDAEVGGPTPILGRYGLNLYVGGYNFSGNGNYGGNFQGVSGRLQSQITEDVSFGVQVTDDHVFGLNTQFQVFVNLPNGRPSRYFRNLKVQDRLTQNVFRQYRVVANTDKFNSYTTAIDPNTHKPYFVAFINPNLTVNGNGTSQSPFNSVAAYEATPLAQQQGYNIIMVAPRTDGTHTQLDTNGPTGTLNLYSDQQLLSTSINQTIFTQNLPGVPVTLAATSSGANPLLYNSAGANVVTMNGGNAFGETVSGFQIAGSATGNGIYGNGLAASLLGPTIENNSITGGLNGVLLQNAVGSLSTVGGVTSIGSAGQILNNTFANNVNNGVEVMNFGTPPAVNPLFLVVQKNTFNKNGQDGLQLDALGGATISGIIGGPNTTATGTTPAVTRSNTFSNNGTNGLDLVANGGILNFSPPTPAVAQNALFGVANNAPGIYNNTFTNNVNGLNMSSMNQSITSFTVQNNNFGLQASPTSGNTQYGLNLTADSGSNTIEIGGATTTNPDGSTNNPGNLFYYNAVSAINLSGLGAAPGSGSLNYDITNNTVQNSVTTTAAAPHDEFVFAFNGTSGTTPFTITNNSDPGVNITSVVWNLAGTAASIAPTTAAGGANPAVIQPVNDTYMNSLNSLAVVVGSKPLLLTATNTIANNANSNLAAGTQLLPLGFTGFAPKNTFQATSLFEQNGGSAALTSAATSGSTLTVTFSNGLVATDKVALQPSVGPQAVGVTGDVFGVQTPGYGNGSDGIHVLTNNMTNNTSSIQSNSVTGYGAYGIHVETGGATNDPNLVINNNILSSNGTGINGAGSAVFTGGGLQVAQHDTSTLAAVITSNTINSNFNYGYTVLSDATGGSLAVNSQDNTATNNASNGFNLSASNAANINGANAGLANVGFISNRDNFIGNGGASAKNASPTGGDNMSINTAGTSNSTIQFNNVLANSSSGSGLSSAKAATGNGLSTTTNDTSILNLTIASPTDPLFTAGTNSSFSTNKLNGLLFSTNGTSLLNLLISGTSGNSNAVNGIAFERAAASLIQSTITTSSFNSNSLNGFYYQGSGGDPNDATQQLSGTANNINLTQDTFNSNGVTTNAFPTGDGAYVNGVGQSVLVLNATTSQFENNVANGLRVDLTPGGQFGWAANNQFSTFDNVTMTGNGVNGIMFTATGGGTASHTYFLLNSDVGSSVVSNNKGNGIEAQYTNGSHTIRISGDDQATPVYQTLIQSNSGDGILSQAGLGSVVNLQIESFNATTSDIFIGGPNAANANKGNGVNFQATDMFTINSSQGGVPVNFTSNTAGTGSLTMNYVTVQNNTLNGINLYGNGLSASQLATGPGGTNIPYQNNFNDASGTINATVMNSQILNNGQDGVNVEILGRMNGNTLIFTGNTIASNLNGGFNMELNAAQQVETAAGALFREAFFQNPATTPATVPLNWLNYAASLAQPLPSADGFNYGTNAPIFLSNWMNLYTQQNTYLQMYSNKVRYNGENSSGSVVNPAADGVHIRVGSNTYLSADIGGPAATSADGNTMSGNTRYDFYVESFLSYNPATYVTPIPGTATAPGTVSVNAGGTAPNIPNSTVFLDDTAQIDMRFYNNTGNSMHIVQNSFVFLGENGNVQGNTAIYPYDPVKDYNITPGGQLTGLPRPAQLFQVDNTAGLNSNNIFSLSNVQNAFSNASWNLTTATPWSINNGNYPQDSNTNPGNPFLP